MTHHGTIEVLPVEVVDVGAINLCQFGNFCKHIYRHVEDLSHVCYPKCHSFHVIMSCLIVSVYNVHSGFRLRSIVTAHMNVLPKNDRQCALD